MPEIAKYALEGKIVTMNDDREVFEQGVIYIDGTTISALRPSRDSAPAGFETSPVFRTGGTIYPGLIELHNHLSYNALPLWDVPKSYTNRAQWAGTTLYRKLVSGPMSILGQTPGYVEALVRYVECKCLLGGVTTSQGIALFSNAGIQKYYSGVVRNVESPDDPALPAARTKISDVEAHSAQKFLETQQSNPNRCLLLHLSEGVDAKAREHFLALQLADGSWAITPSLVGIHSAGLELDDFRTLSEHGAAMVWSPLSNMLLYGQTANIRAAKDSGVLIGLGSDWSVSGSKNLFGELKVARLVSDHLGSLFSDSEIVAMATCDAAKILRWDHALGSLAPGKHADLLVVTGRRGDPYQRLIEAKETAIALVVIDGVARYGQLRLMKALATRTEAWQVGRAKRLLNLTQETADPVVGALSLRDAQKRLRDGMKRLPELALELERPTRALPAGDTPQWFLLLDHNDTGGGFMRAHLPFGVAAQPTGEVVEELSRALLSEIVEPLGLDPLTVADDRHFLMKIGKARNVPDFVKEGLRKLY